MLLSTGVRTQEHSTGTLLNSECTGGDKLYSVEEIWCFKLSTGEGKLVLYCFQEKGSGALLFSGEGSSALLFSGEGIWCSTIFRRKELVHYCSQEKELVLY